MCEDEERQMPLSRIILASFTGKIRPRNDENKSYLSSMIASTHPC
jgi:hypothetical protein